MQVKVLQRELIELVIRTGASITRALREPGGNGRAP
jgi:hypothetical protein